MKYFIFDLLSGLSLLIFSCGRGGSEIPVYEIKTEAIDV